MKFVLTIFIFLSFSLDAKTQEQIDFNKFKNKVRIGIYISPQLNIHSKLITEVGHYYESEKPRLDSEVLNAKNDTSIYADNRRKLAAFLKARHDTADAIDRLFTCVTWFIAAEFNRTYDVGEKINYNDTIFLPQVKIEKCNQLNRDLIINRDTLDYCVSVNDIHSVAKDNYYQLVFSIHIQPKQKSLKEINQECILPFTNQQKSDDSFLGCEKPFECLLANTIYFTLQLISEKLRNDGYGHK